MCIRDRVTADYENVRYLKDFDGFEGDPLPAAGAEEYREYMRRSMAVIRARNERIAHYSPSRQATSCLRNSSCALAERLRQKWLPGSSGRSTPVGATSGVETQVVRSLLSRTDSQVAESAAFHSAMLSWRSPQRQTGSPRSFVA